jgi:hypothetical protein
LSGRGHGFKSKLGDGRRFKVIFLEGVRHG